MLTIKITKNPAVSHQGTVYVQRATKQYEGSPPNNHCHILMTFSVNIYANGTLHCNTRTCSTDSRTLALCRAALDPSSRQELRARPSARGAAGREHMGQLRDTAPASPPRANGAEASNGDKEGPEDWKRL